MLAQRRKWGPALKQQWVNVSCLLGAAYHMQVQWHGDVTWLNPFKPELTIVIFIQYKPRIADAILSTCSVRRWIEVGGKCKNIVLLKKQF